MNVKFVTLGCKTNQYETNAMEQSFKNAVKQMQWSRALKMQDMI